MAAAAMMAADAEAAIELINHIALRSHPRTDGCSALGVLHGAEGGGQGCC